MINKKVALYFIILILAIGNYNRIIENENIKWIQFISILTLGIIIGVLFVELLQIYKSKK